ncbi:MAG: asparagine synthase C-terminal domain-containing protein [Gelidibacter sp.]
MTFEAAKSQLEDLLKNAFNLRMVSDVPVGVFLSGGYDSSLVTAILQSQQHAKLKTFTIAFDDPKYDESKFANEIATLLGTDHSTFVCSEKNAMDIIPKLADYFDEPFGDPSLIPTMLLSEKTKEKVTVSLSADAGDETFFGYNSYEKIHRYYYKLKRMGPLANIVNKLKKNDFREKYYSVNFNKKDALARMLDIYHQKYKDAFVQTIFNVKIDPLKTNFDSEAYDSIEMFHKLLAIDYTTYMADNILVKVDRATMSASLEGREPLLDHRIVEFAARLPMRYLFEPKTRTKKYILRELCHKYLPKELMDRKKTGFTPPILSWLRTDLKEFTVQMLSEDELDKHRLLNVKTITIALQRFMAGDDKYYNLIWNALVFQIWYEKWMDNE